jgi:hypothetical protein
VFGGRVFVLLGLALAAASCVESGNYGWDLGQWEPPLVAAPEVEAFRGVHEGRIGLRCRKGGEPVMFVETWRPLVPAGAPGAATMTYRVDGAEHSAPGRLGPRGFEFAAHPALLRRLAEASHLEALVPVHGGGVYPVTFDIGDFARAHEWVRGECAKL